MNTLVKIYLITASTQAKKITDGRKKSRLSLEELPNIQQLVINNKMLGSIKDSLVKDFKNFLTKKAKRFMSWLKKYFKEVRIRANKKWTSRELRII